MSSRLGFLFCVHLCSSVILFSSGCRGPHKANIELRKQNQDLRDQVEQLERARTGDRAMIAALQDSSSTTMPALPQGRLDKLFTVHGIRLARLTGGAKLRPDSPADDALKVYVVPIDDAGDELKAAGSFVVEAFDLNRSSDPLVGRWEFTVEDARKSWFGDALLYNFVLTCPLNGPAKSDSLTVKVTFTDELTGRVFDTQKIVKLTLAPRSP